MPVAVSIGSELLGLEGFRRSGGADQPVAGALLKGQLDFLSIGVGIVIYFNESGGGGRGVGFGGADRDVNVVELD